MSSNVTFNCTRIERRIWVGTPNGIDRMVGDRFVNLFIPSQTTRLTDLRAIDPASILEWMITDAGIFRVENDGRFTSLRISTDGMVETEQGDLWLNGTAFSSPPGGLQRLYKQRNP